MASRSINKVTLLGNLTRDPELKYTPSGAPVCTFGLATNRAWTTAEGTTKEDVQYHRITAWHKLAELCSKLLVKGRKVYLEGRLTYRNYTDKAGQPRSITEIILDDFILLDSKPGAEHVTATSHDEPSTADMAPEDPMPAHAAPPEDESIKPSDIPF